MHNHWHSVIRRSEVGQGMCYCEFVLIKEKITVTGSRLLFGWFYLFFFGPNSCWTARNTCFNAFLRLCIRVCESAGELLAFGIMGQTKVWFAVFDSKIYRKVSDHEYYRRQY